MAGDRFSGLLPQSNVYVIKAASDLPQVLDRYRIYHLTYDPGTGAGLYYSPDAITLVRLATGGSTLPGGTVDNSIIRWDDGGAQWVEFSLFILPTADGALDQIMQTDGAGTVSWVDPPTSGITVEDEGAPLATDADTLNFIGDGVTASGAGTTKDITVLDQQNDAMFLSGLFNTILNLSQTLGPNVQVDLAGALGLSSLQVMYLLQPVPPQITVNDGEPLTIDLTSAANDVFALRDELDVDIMRASDTEVVFNRAIQVDYSTFETGEPQFAATWDPTVAITSNYVGGMLSTSVDFTVTTGVFIPAIFSDTNLYRINAAPGFSAITFINELSVVQNVGNFNLPGALVMNIGLVHSRTTAGTSTTANKTGISFSPQTRATVNGAIMTLTGQTAVRCSPTFSTVAGSTANLGTIVGLDCFAPAVALFQPQAGTENMTAYYGLRMPNITFGGAGRVVAAVHSSLNIATNVYHINAPGTAPSIFGGDVAAPTFNDVPLTDAGVATNYLDETGAYSVPVGTGGQVDSVSGGTNINVTGTAVDPIVNLDAAIVGVSVNGVTLTTGGVATNFLNETGAYSVPDHTAISNIGTNSHAAIDLHIADLDIHYSDAPADGTPYERIDNTWQVAGTSGSSIVAAYRFQTSTTEADPGNGNLRYDNATPASVTELYISYTTDNNVDLTNILGFISAGDRVYIQQDNDSSKYLLFDVTVNVDNGTWTSLEGSVSNSGTIPDSNGKIHILILFGAASGSVVTSFEGRVGAVTALQADYDAFFLTQAEGDALYQPLGTYVTSITGGTNINVGGTATVPIVNLDAAITGVSVNGVTLSDAGAATAYLDETGNYSVPVGSGGAVDSVTGGTNINVTGTGADPIVNLDAALLGVSVNGVTLSDAGAATSYLDETGNYSVPVGSGGAVDTVTGGTNINVSGTGADPIVNLDAAIVGVSVNGVTLSNAGAATAYLDETGAYSVPAGSGGQVDSVVGGTNISVNAADPVNPIVNLDAAITGVSVNGVTLDGTGAATSYLNQAGGYSVPPNDNTGITELTGDVTAGPGSGSQAATIPNDTVDNAKLANMANNTIKARGGGAGDPQDWLVGTNEILGNQGGALVSAQVNTAQILNLAVTYAKMQNATGETLLGRQPGGFGNVEEITLGTNLSMTGSVLNASGGGSPGGADTQIQYNDGGAFGGDGGLVYDDSTKVVTIGIGGVGGNLLNIRDGNTTGALSVAGILFQDQTAATLGGVAHSIAGLVLQSQASQISMIAGVGGTSRVVMDALSIMLEEKAAPGADATGYGQFWIDSADNLPYYRDEVGTDYPLTGSGSIGGSIAVNQIAVGSGVDTIAGDPDFTWNGTVFDINLGDILVNNGQIDIHNSGGGKLLIWENSNVENTQFQQVGDHLYVTPTATGGQIQLRAPGETVIYDSTLRHTRSSTTVLDAYTDLNDFLWDFSNNRDWVIAGTLTGEIKIDHQVAIRAGERLYLYGADNADMLNLRVDSTANQAYLETNNMNYLNIGFGGMAVRFVNPGGTIYGQLYHNGTDFTISTGSGDGPIILQHEGLNDALQTQNRAATGNTTGAQVWDHAGVLHDVGYNDLQIFNDNVSDTLEAGHAGQIAFKDAATARTLTLASNVDLDFPIETMTTVMNAFTSGNYTVNEGASTTLYVLDGTTRVDSAGGITIGPGGVVNIWRESATVYYCWGSGITP